MYFNRSSDLGYIDALFSLSKSKTKEIVFDFFYYVFCVFIKKGGKNG